jgi:hypothetical protein
LLYDRLSRPARGSWLEERLACEHDLVARKPPCERTSILSCIDDVIASFKCKF